MAEEIKLLQNPDLEKIIFGKVGREAKIQKLENMMARKVGKKAKFLLDKAIELAEGIYMMDDKDPYKIKYYKVKPDLDAIIYLCDRLFGKPVAKSEVKDDTNKKGIAAVQDIITQLAGVGLKTLNPNNENGNEKFPTVTISSVNVRSGEDALQKRLE